MGQALERPGGHRHHDVSRGEPGEAALEELVDTRDGEAFRSRRPKLRREPLEVEAILGCQAVMVEDWGEKGRVGRDEGLGIRLVEEGSAGGQAAGLEKSQDPAVGMALA